MATTIRLANKLALLGRTAALLVGLTACACGGGNAPSATATPLPTPDISPVAVGTRASALAAGWQHGPFMEIYVRGYQDSDGDGIGDLRGLTQRLDYLAELGIRGIWLMPITRSQDHDHGYAVSDYRNVEPEFGTLADFDALIAAAHARGIAIIIDYVLNHSAAQHPLFINSSADATNPYRDWYVWSESVQSGWRIFNKNPWVPTAHGAYLSQFSSTMPDFNLRNPAVLAFHENNLRFWLNRGVDGFRFDAVAHLVENGPDAWYNQPENVTVVARLRRVLRDYDQRYLVCEATDNAVAWAAEGACGAAFAFGHQGDIVAAARNQASGIQAVAQYFGTAPPSMATMISNHDLFAGERLWDQVGGNLAQYRLAAATYLLQPGTPFIYYGEEIGLSAASGLTGDAKVRVPMSWSPDAANAGFTSAAQPFRRMAANAPAQNVASQRGDPNSLLASYRQLIALRNQHPSLAQGTYIAPAVQGSVLSFQRWSDAERTLVILNYGTAPATVAVGGLGANTRWGALLPGGNTEASADAVGQVQLTLPAQSVQIYLRKP